MAITDHIPQIPNHPPGQIRPYPEPSITGRMPFSYNGSGPASSLSGETAYFVWGDLASEKTPLLVIHGGPGMAHDYMLPFALIAEDYSIPVVMYDQIGCGQSSRFKDQAGNESFWTVELFMEELAAVIKHLQIDRYDLLGHSWAGFLSGSFAIRKQPPGLRKLVIRNSPPSLKLMEPVSTRMREEMPKEVQDAIDQCEAADSFDSPEGQAAMQYAYTLHGCRVTPWPKELMACLLGLAEDNTVYKTMAGSSAFTMKGSITRVPGLENRICEITEKTCPGGLLVVTAEFDLASREIHELWLKEPKCKVQHVHLKLSSHFVMLEETEELMKAIGVLLES